MINNVKVNSEHEMGLQGAALAKRLDSGTQIIFLSGDLGAGKTMFVRGFLREWGYKGSVTSPTYTFVEPYQLKGRDVFHIDLYRLNDPAELEYLGLFDELTEGSIYLIEWPEKAKGYLPQPSIYCTIRMLLGENSREITLKQG